MSALLASAGVVLTQQASHSQHTSSLAAHRTPGQHPLGCQGWGQSSSILRRGERERGRGRGKEGEEEGDRKRERGGRGRGRGKGGSIMQTSYFIYGQKFLS